MRDLSRDENLFAVERRAIVTVCGEQQIRWQPQGLYSAQNLEEAIEKAAFDCQIPSVLRATYIGQNEEPAKIQEAFEQGSLPLF